MTDSKCQHKKTHEETIFIDLEDDGKVSYDVYKVCNDCKESWFIRDFEDDGKTLSKIMGFTS